MTAELFTPTKAYIKEYISFDAIPDGVYRGTYCGSTVFFTVGNRKDYYLQMPVAVKGNGECVVIVRSPSEPGVKEVRVYLVTRLD